MSRAASCDRVAAAQHRVLHRRRGRLEPAPGQPGHPDAHVGPVAGEQGDHRRPGNALGGQRRRLGRGHGQRQEEVVVAGHEPRDVLAAQRCEAGRQEAQQQRAGGLAAHVQLVAHVQPLRGERQDVDRALALEHPRQIGADAVAQEPQARDRFVVAHPHPQRVPGPLVQGRAGARARGLVLHHPHRHRGRAHAGHRRPRGRGHCRSPARSRRPRSAPRRASRSGAQPSNTHAASSARRCGSQTRSHAIGGPEWSSVRSPRPRIDLAGRRHRARQRPRALDARHRARVGLLHRVAVAAPERRQGRDGAARRRRPAGASRRPSPPRPVRAARPRTAAARRSAPPGAPPARPSHSPSRARPRRARRHRPQRPRRARQARPRPGRRRPARRRRRRRRPRRARGRAPRARRRGDPPGLRGEQPGRCRRRGGGDEPRRRPRHGRAAARAGRHARQPRPRARQGDAGRPRPHRRPARRARGRRAPHARRRARRSRPSAPAWPACRCGRRPRDRATRSSPRSRSRASTSPTGPSGARWRARDPERLRTDGDALVEVAEGGLAHAARDVSMPGVAGSLLQLSELAKVGATLDLDALPRPDTAPLERWLITFPSFGFVLAARPDRAERGLRSVPRPRPRRRGLRRLRRHRPARALARRGAGHGVGPAPRAPHRPRPLNERRSMSIGR